MRNEWWDVVRSCWTVWVPVQLFVFSVLPGTKHITFYISKPVFPKKTRLLELTHRFDVAAGWRVIFVNGVMVGWNVVIDHMSQRSKHGTTIDENKE